MKEINQLQIMEGIASAIRSEFPTSNIYKHKVPQALEEGSFVVRFITSVRPERFMDRVKILSSFEVIYYGHENPNDPDVLTDDLLHVESILPAILHKISTPNGGVVHALDDMSISPVEDRLQATVRYQHHVLEMRLIKMVDEHGNPLIDDQGNPMVDDQGNPIEIDEKQLQDELMQVLERNPCREVWKGEQDGETTNCQENAAGGAAVSEGDPAAV